MYSARDDTALPVPGFPIRVSAGQSLFSSSPRLIAAVHALLRLLMPRHPPCALTILTVIVDSRRYARGRTPTYNGDLLTPLRKQACAAAIPLFGQLCSFQGSARAQPEGLSGRSLKTQQCKGPPRGRLLQIRSTFRDARRPRGRRTGSSEMSSLERR